MRRRIFLFLDDTVFTESVTVDARTYLRAIMNESFGIAENIGYEERKKLKDDLK